MMKPFKRFSDQLFPRKLYSGFGGASRGKCLVAGGGPKRATTAERLWALRPSSLQRGEIGRCYWLVFFTVVEVSSVLVIGLWVVVVSVSVWPLPMRFGLSVSVWEVSQP